jgi:hypothetical protein
MTSRSEWSLKEIRAAYSEILKAYNALFPIYPNIKREKDETIQDNFDPGGDKFYSEILPKKFRENFRRLQKAADQSGNPMIWHRGDPLDGLSPGMRERIERALKFGI